MYYVWCGGGGGHSPMGSEAAELGADEAPPPGDGGAVSADRAWHKNNMSISNRYCFLESFKVKSLL